MQTKLEVEAGNWKGIVQIGWHGFELPAGTLMDGWVLVKGVLEKQERPSLRVNKGKIQLADK